MQLIDTHTHLFLEQFDKDRDEVVNRAIKSGVEKLFLPNIDSSSITDMLNLANKYPDNCYPLMGLHPTSVDENFEKELETVEEYLKKQKFYGIGEIGIDLYWDKTFLPQQEQAFIHQIKLAKQYSLPIVIHVRDSFEETLKIVDKYNNDKLTGIFHCFTGSYEQAQHIIQYGGFKLGIGGVLTFKNSKLDQVVQKIPLEHIVLETDSPYLAPSPYRGKRNESAYVVKVAEKLAEIYGLPLQEVAKITSDNAGQIFGV